MEGGELVCYRGRTLQSWCGDCRQLRPERRQADRRQARPRFYWFENRSGFDNRLGGAAPAWPWRSARAMRDDPGLLVKVLLLFNVCNLADYVLTARALAAGHREINPIMGSLFALDPVLAGVFKIATGLAVTLLIWRFRRFRIILQLSLFAMGLYLALIAYHLCGVVTC